MKYVSPVVYGNAFTCPYCGVFSKQTWDSRSIDFSNYGNYDNKILRICQCDHCSKFSVWIKETMYYPNNSNAPFPNSEMPENVKEIYMEAASIATKSPRGAAALMRLAIQELCKELGGKGKNINEDIGSLVKKGLPVMLQQALDSVRLIGNSAVHPGQIDVDDQQVVSSLFDLTNLIVEQMIELPNKVKGIYKNLPEGAVKAIEDRDKTK